MRIDTINFVIVPAYKTKNMPQLSEMWEQVRVIIGENDIINSVGFTYDHHWGIESACFLAQKNDYYKGQLLIGICTCTCEGDDDILADIDSSEKYVSWKVFHQRNLELKESFVFEKKQYKKALDEAISHITKKPRDVHEWSWLLSYSKKELYESIENEND